MNIETDHQQNIPRHKLQSTLLRDQEALATYSGFWTRQMITEIDKPKSQFERVQQAQAATEAFIAKNTSPDIFVKKPLGLGSKLDQFFAAVDWQTKQQNPADFTQLPILGIDFRGMETLNRPSKYGRVGCPSADHRAEVRGAGTERAAAVGLGDGGIVVAGPQSQSNLNALAGSVVANMAMVPVGADGTFCVYVSSSMHLAVDVMGTFSATGNQLYVPVTPLRVHDSRQPG